MSIRITLIASNLIAASLVSGAANAALQGRDLNGSASSFEAYYDTVLNISWLADANYAQTSGYDADGLMNWADANNWAATLSLSDGVNVYDNWRLPTTNPVNGVSFNYEWTTDGSSDNSSNITSPNNEMAYMFYVTLANPGYITPAGALSGCNTSGSNSCLGNVGPFSNLQHDVYWSGSEPGYSQYPIDAWRFHMNDGSHDSYYKTSYYYAWAVSSGDVAAVPEAQTYALMLAGLGLIGWRARRRG